FPIAVTRLIKNNALTSNAKTDIKYQKPIEEQAQVNDLVPGDRILIRNGELIPVDGILIKGAALIDYSFVTGEAEPISKSSGDTLYAGSKQQAGVIELEVTKSISQSYLTQLWSNEVFTKKQDTFYKNITDKVSKHFTISIISIAALATLFWVFYNPSLALHVFTAVLIIACPCAIALAAPFTLGNMLRIFGKHKFYVKNASVLEQLAAVNTLIFDKTGTLTSTKKTRATYEGEILTETEEKLL